LKYFIKESLVLKQKLFTHSSSKGFTVLELLVASMLGSLIVGLAISATMVNRGTYLDDLSRVRLNQNLRSALDVVGMTVREAGENLSATFPAIILNNESENSRLTLRRNLLDEVLKVCASIDAGTSGLQVYFAVSDSISGCGYSDQQHNAQSWQNHLEQEGGTALAYIYNASIFQGEFFIYNAIGDSGTQRYLQRAGGNWANDYNTTSSAIYILEEWEFQIDDGVMQIIEDGNTAVPLNVVDGIESFQVRAIMADGSIADSFGSGQSWPSIRTIEIEVSGLERSPKNTFEASLSGQFFPRNILSH